jgi:hypothetical protein
MGRPFPGGISPRPGRNKSRRPRSGGTRSRDACAYAGQRCGHPGCTGAAGLVRVWPARPTTWTCWSRGAGSTPVAGKAVVFAVTVGPVPGTGVDPPRSGPGSAVSFPAAPHRSVPVRVCSAVSVATPAVGERSLPTRARPRGAASGCRRKPVGCGPSGRGPDSVKGDTLVRRQGRLGPCVVVMCRSPPESRGMPRPHAQSARAL